VAYLISYKTSFNNEEVREIVDDTNSAAKFIENLLKDNKAAENDITLYAITPVPFKVERVPVVKLNEVDEQQPTSNSSTEENSSEEESNSEQDQSEVYTFEAN
jgi:hypothetical protein